MNPILELITKPDELQELVATQMRWARACLIDAPHDAWTPSLLVELLYPPSQGGHKAHEMVSLHVPFNTDEEKWTALRGVGRMFAERGPCPVGLVLVTQAWLSRDTPPGMRPCDDAFRQDVLLSAGKTAAGYACLTFAPVLTVDGYLRTTEADPVRNAEFPLLDAVYRGYLAAVRDRNQRSSAPSPN